MELWARDQERFQEVARIIQGIVQVAGGRFVKKTNLFKAFYWAHRYFWREHNGTLTKDPGIVRMPNGPGIDRHEDLLAWMERKGLIRTEGGDGEYDSYVFHLVAPVELNDDELAAIQKAVRKVGGRSAGSVSDESHKKSRSWREGKNGDRLDIYYDEISNEQLAHMKKGLARTRKLVDDVFGSDSG